MTIKKLTFSSSHSTGLNFGPSCKSYFSLWNDSSRTKIRVKSDEISIKFKNPYYMFDYFQIKKSWFWAVFTQKIVPTEQQLGLLGFEFVMLANHDKTWQKLSLISLEWSTLKLKTKNWCSGWKKKGVTICFIRLVLDRLKVAYQ